MNFNPARSFRKIVAIAQRSRLDRELAEEMETHRILLARDGGNPGPLMGNITLAREESRDMWTFRQLEWILQDARHALRGLRRSFSGRIQATWNQSERVVLEPGPSRFGSISGDGLA